MTITRLNLAIFNQMRVHASLVGSNLRVELCTVSCYWILRNCLIVACKRELSVYSQVFKIQDWIYSYTVYSAGCYFKVIKMICYSLIVLATAQVYPFQQLVLNDHDNINATVSYIKVEFQGIWQCKLQKLHACQVKHGISTTFQPYKCYALCYLQEQYFNPRIKSVLAAPKMSARKSCIFNQLMMSYTNQYTYKGIDCNLK